MTEKKPQKPRTKEQIEGDISLWKSIRTASRDGAQRARAAKRVEALNAELKALAAALIKGARG